MSNSTHLGLFHIERGRLWALLFSIIVVFADVQTGYFKRGRW